MSSEHSARHPERAGGAVRIDIAGPARGGYGGSRYRLSRHPIACAAATLAAVAAVAARGSTAHSGENGAHNSAGPPPVITKAEAQQVLAHYVSVNNAANKSRSDSLLSTIESGSSYRMDSGTYRFERATDPANKKYSPLYLKGIAYYIPRQSGTSYPRWFVASVDSLSASSPRRVIGTGYVVFSQEGRGAAWKEVGMPYSLSAGPRIATGSQGYATAIAQSAGTPGLATAPGQIQSVTTASLDGTSGAVQVPENLADQRDRLYWMKMLPFGGSDKLKHYADQNRVYALKTADGGALIFYSLTGKLSLYPPHGRTFAVSIPGFYSPTENLTSATMGYVDQFATYVPQAAGLVSGSWPMPLAAVARASLVAVDRG